MAQKAAQVAQEPADTPGPNEQAVQAFVDTLVLAERGRALAASALTLARQLDTGAGMAAAAVSKELRALIDALTPVEDDDDDFLSSLRSPVVDSTN